MIPDRFKLTNLVAIITGIIGADIACAARTQTDIGDAVLACVWL